MKLENAFSPKNVNTFAMENEKLKKTTAIVLALPSPALCIPGTTDDTEPDEQQGLSKHQGRTRSFPHERGIWASYVFIDCE